MSLGNILHTLIEERHMTQKEIAYQLNIAPSTMSSYVQNAREPDYATLIKIATYFDVSIDYLLDYSPKEQFTINENELLRIFRSLTAEQQSICIEQCKVFLRVNHEKRELKDHSS